jgi:hypothetical protein
MSHAATKWAIDQRGIKPAAKIVLWQLCDRYHPDHGCFPSLDTLAHDCEMSRRSVQDQLEILEQRGLIRIEKMPRRDGRLPRNRYRFAFEWGAGTLGQNLPKEEIALGKNEPSPLANSCKDLGQNLPTNLVRVTSKGIGNKSQADDLTAEFENVWAHYPRKVGKGAALAEWRKARRHHSFDAISQPLGQFVRLVKGTDPSKIPHLRTWLHQERWEDNQADAVNRPRTSADDIEHLATITAADDLARLFAEPLQLRAVK